MPDFASDSNPYMGIARNLGEIFLENPRKNRLLQQQRAEEAEQKRLRELREVQQAAAREEQQKRSAAQATFRQHQQAARQQIPGAIQEAIAQQMPADLSPEDRQRQQVAMNLTNQLIQAGLTPTPILRALNLAPVMPMNPQQTRMAEPHGARGGRNLGPVYGPERPIWPFHEGIKVGR